MNLLAVAKQADRKPSQARVIYQRLPVIRELDSSLRRSSSSAQSGSVKEILFSFYSGELRRLIS